MARHRTSESVSWTPGPKAYSAGGGGALTLIVVWVLHGVGVDVPEVVAAAIATVLATVGAYLAPQWTDQPPAVPTRALTDTGTGEDFEPPLRSVDGSTALPPESTPPLTDEDVTRQ